MIRVLVVDDHPLIRAGLGALLATQRDMQLVGEADTAERGLELFRALAPDVVLMDLRLPGIDGLEAIRRLRAERHDARVIALTVYDGDADIQQALEAGALGYLLKDMLQDELLNAVRAVHAGRRAIPPTVAQRLAEFAGAPSLTEREREVLTLVATGLRNRDIAAAVGRTEETVKVHVKRVLAKLGASDRTEAVAIALRRGLIRLD